MKTLIIHPTDKTTDFLKPIYLNIKDKTVIRGGVTQEQLKQLIFEHDRIIMLGHGTLFGLMNLKKFHYYGNHIIDVHLVNTLREKKDTIYIWCDADQFVNTHSLKGLYTGFFISEMQEAAERLLKIPAEKLIQESNQLFSKVIGQNIDRPLEKIYQILLKEYVELINDNPVAQYNYQRIYYR